MWHEVGMCIAIVPNRNSRPAVLLREGYREGGKVRNRTLANLSALPMDQVEAIRRILKGEKFVGLEDAFETISSFRHGHVKAVLLAMERLGVDKLIRHSALPTRMKMIHMQQWTGS
jgi:hypothetical protein